jgi:hypothetical protein
MGLLDFDGPAYAVKVKEPGAKRWLFLGGDGYLTSRRIHAALASKQKAERYAAAIPADNPGCQAKAVRF